MKDSQPQPPLHPFKKYMKDQEMRVRGVYLMMAVDTDWMLGAIIVTIIGTRPMTDFIRLLRQAGIKKKTIPSDLTLDEKTKMVKECMKEIRPDLWIKHEEDLKEVDKLRMFRNLFAHGKIDWDEVNEDGSQMMISTMEADGIHTTTHNRKALWKNLIDYTNNLKSLLESINYELIPPDAVIDPT